MGATPPLQLFLNAYTPKNDPFFRCVAKNDDIGLSSFLVFALLFIYHSEMARHEFSGILEIVRCEL